MIDVSQGDTLDDHQRKNGKSFGLDLDISSLAMKQAYRQKVISNWVSVKQFILAVGEHVWFFLNP